MKNNMNNICAGIVLYNPNIKLLCKNLKAIMPQIDHMILYDNGSKDAELIKNSVVTKFNKITYYSSPRNMGIAYGINWILKKAKEFDFMWCLTLDQDSVCSKDMIYQYKKYISLPDVALISPFVLNNNKITLAEYYRLNLPDVEYVNDPIGCITSGCLTNVNIFLQLHGVNSKLFIDFVDVELNCKILNNGYKIIRVNKAYLIQKMGKAKEVPIFKYLYRKTGLNIFQKMQIVAVYPNNRLYYSSRNSRYIQKKFKYRSKRTSLLFMLAYYCYFSVSYPKERSRMKMWKAIITGFNDYKKIM